MAATDDRISRYITDLFAIQDEALRMTRELTPKKGLPAISITPEEGRFLQFLARACSARKALELGTLGGYSGIWIARRLVEGGRLITVEMDPHHAQAARENLANAGLAKQVQVRVGDAHQMLSLLAGEGPFDFIFIDADKAGYPEYYDWALENARLGGVIAFHNVLRGGQVTETEAVDERTRLMRALYHKASCELRLISTIYPGGDGILVAIKIA